MLGMEVRVRRLWLVLPLTGCVTTAVLQSPEPLGKGKVEVAAEPGVVGIGTPGEGYLVPVPGFRAQWGVSDRVDVGGRLTATGLGAVVKGTLTEPGTDGVALALAGSLSVGTLPDEGLWSVVGQVPLVVGVPLGEHALVFGPQLHTWAFKDGPGGFELAVGPGAQLGTRLALGPHWFVFPEASGTWFLASGLGGPQARVGPANGPVYQGMVGIGWRGN